MAIVIITLAFFVAQAHGRRGEGVLCMPVTGICRDKVGLGIARKHIGKISSWIEMDTQHCRPSNDRSSPSINQN